MEFLEYLVGQMYGQFEYIFFIRFQNQHVNYSTISSLESAYLFPMNCTGWHFCLFFFPQDGIFVKFQSIYFFVQLSYWSRCVFQNTKYQSDKQDMFRYGVI
eukprot:TRINITY_DN1947_c0_g1_i2.p4 TRINITY_DN1947_c0_g1~~TRINITY_DN1947_c0_g1_i2.p4  ORF type:complete len:101 (-),score=0.07 TRINITY_DN1947_c0_g1_i2:174-476(-)